MKTISVSRQQIITALRPNNAIERVSYLTMRTVILSVITSVARGAEDRYYYESEEVMFYDSDSLSSVERGSSSKLSGVDYEYSPKTLELDPLNKYYLVAGNKCPVFTYFAAVSVHGEVQIYRTFNTKKLEAFQMSLRNHF